jgi:hypothetical protein
MKKHFILLSTLTIGVAAYSQVGVNTATPNATFDVMGIPADLTKTDGFIAPRLKGSEVKAKDSNYTTLQTGAIVYITEALIPADTTPKTVNVTALGYYYFDGSTWQKMTGGGAAGTNPWDLENTTTTATLNNQNIYQSGNVGIGNFSSAKPIAKLDVRGAVRGGTPHADELSGTSLIGTNSVALGFENKASGPTSSTIGWKNIASGDRSHAIGTLSIASGDYSFAAGPQSSEATGYISTAIGFYARASGYGSTAIGMQPEASNIYSVAIGLNAKASGLYALALSTHTATASGGQSVAIGGGTTASGEFATAMGRMTTSSSLSETVMGTRNAIATGTAGSPVPTDALFQVGNGVVDPFPTFNNALTILKNAHTAIGVNGVEDIAKPTELLDLGGSATQGNGGLRIRNINSAAYTGTATDRIVVANPTGVLKTVPVASLSAADFNFSSLPTYANDSSAASGGLTSGKLYKTAGGEIRIKL